MLVYGDHRETVAVERRLEVLAARLDLVSQMAAGIDRHAKLVGVLIEAGGLLQGVEDKGCRAPELGRLVLGLARCVARSWDSGYGETGELPLVEAMPLPDLVEVCLPEGFAFYALYPEAYLEAARRLRLSGPPMIIGIRSIGTTLGAMVAAALGTCRTISVRPHGDPFARKVDLADDIVDAFSHYVIVDEGPGLSGSSFGSVADWLEARGVPLERIAFMPSHAGDPGAQASKAHVRRWRRAQRVPAGFDQRFLERHFGPLAEFVTGAPFEQRKFIAKIDGARALLKFAGLGASGEEKFAIARALHAGGFTPEPLALVHGFIAERWCEGARPLGKDQRPLERIGNYIGARARLFPAADASGATIDELIGMSRRNISLWLGDGAASALDRWDGGDLAARVKRVRTDNKMDPAEWLALGDGGLVKTDALDHHKAHDLVGCQGAEWDVAGAIEEFQLDRADASRLIAATSVPVDGQLLSFYRLAYAAFRLGQAVLGGLDDSARTYGASVERLLHQGSSAWKAAGILG